MTESPSLTHNRTLLTEFVAKSKVYSRYPKVSDQVECLPLDASKLPPFAYNPSIWRYGGKTWMTYRYHFKEGNFFTKIGMSEISSTGAVLSAQEMALGDLSCEDARVFMWRDEPWMSWVESNWNGQANPRSVIKYSKLERPIDEPEKRKWQVSRAYQPAPHVNDGKSVQKNWVFFESDENLFCLFQSWAPNQVVFQMQGDAVVNEYKTPPVSWPYGQLRGDCIVPYDGKLLRLFHSTTERGIGGKEIRYYIGAALMNPKPPFETIAVSKKPIIFGSEIDSLTPAQRKSCFHWRTLGKSIVIPYGIIPDGNGFIISLGVNDAACTVSRIKPEQFNL